MHLKLLKVGLYTPRIRIIGLVYGFSENVFSTPCENVFSEWLGFFSEQRHPAFL